MKPQRVTHELKAGEGIWLVNAASVMIEVVTRNGVDITKVTVRPDTKEEAR